MTERNVAFRVRCMTEGDVFSCVRAFRDQKGRRAVPRATGTGENEDAYVAPEEQVREDGGGTSATRGSPWRHRPRVRTATSTRARFVPVCASRRQLSLSSANAGRQAD